jgi:hypothetical protein
MTSGASILETVFSIESRIFIYSTKEHATITVGYDKIQQHHGGDKFSLA